VHGPHSALTIRQAVVPLGPCYRVFFHPQVAEAHVLEDGSRQAVLQPTEGERGRAEERLGLVPGSPELSSNEGHGSSRIFGPLLTCADALRRVQHSGFSLVTQRCGRTKLSEGS
jgi:hypothetical protein